MPFARTGTHNLTATYSGDSIYAGSTTPNPVAVTVVSKLPVTIPFLAASPLVMGSPTNMAANLSSLSGGPNMTGTVTFSEGSVTFTDPVSVNGTGASMVAATSHTFTTVGTHNVTVAYSGDSNYQAATSQAFAVNIIGPLSISFPSNSLSLSSSGGTTSTIGNVSNSTT